jgi:hypothetical protein
MKPQCECKLETYVRCESDKFNKQTQVAGEKKQMSLDGLTFARSRNRNGENIRQKC